MKPEAVSLPVLDGHLRLPRAAASAYLLVLISKDGDHRSLPPGRYACELIKEDSGQWRFSRRTVFHDHDYTLDGIAR